MGEVCHFPRPHRLAGYPNPRAMDTPLPRLHHAAVQWADADRDAMVRRAPPPVAAPVHDALPHYADLRNGALLDEALPSWSRRRRIVGLVVGVALTCLFIWWVGQALADAAVTGADWNAIVARAAG